MKYGEPYEVNGKKMWIFDFKDYGNYLLDRGANEKNDTRDKLAEKKRKKFCEIVKLLRDEGFSMELFWFTKSNEDGNKYFFRMVIPEDCFNMSGIDYLDKVFEVWDRKPVEIFNHLDVVLMLYLLAINDEGRKHIKDTISEDPMCKKKIYQESYFEETVRKAWRANVETLRDGIEIIKDKVSDKEKLNTDAFCVWQYGVFKDYFSLIEKWIYVYDMMVFMEQRGELDCKEIRKINSNNENFDFLLQEPLELWETHKQMCGRTRQSSVWDLREIQREETYERILKILDIK